MTLADYSRASVGVDGLLHFMYKSLDRQQVTCLALKPPYHTPKEKERLYRYVLRCGVVRVHANNTLGSINIHNTR